MNTLEDKKSVMPSESERAELNSLVNLACEPVSHFWPMKTFIHHNPLHGLEHFPFEKAINEAERFLRGRGYLPNSEYRKYFKEGRITEESIDKALKDVVQEEKVALSNQELSHREVLKAILIHGTGEVALDVCSAVLKSSHPQAEIKNIFEKIQTLSNNKDLNEFLSGHAKRDEKDLATQYTLAEWFDQTFEADVQDQINRQIIKYVGGFLDEGHAPWGMPMREKNLYAVWKELSLEDDSGTILGIQDWKSKILNLPDQPEDAVLESLSCLGIPKNLWEGYFSLQLAQLAGWTGFIKWRAEQTNYDWQNAFPADLIQYMAIRLFYERELLSQACQEELKISGSYDSIIECLKNHPIGYGLYKEFRSGGLPDEVIDHLNISSFTKSPLNLGDLDGCDSSLVSKLGQIRKKQEIESQTLKIIHLAQSFNISIKDVVDSSPDVLDALVGWIEKSPESQHGPIWLEAFESSYLESFVKKISPNLEKLIKSDEIEEAEKKPTESRPLFQALFCIDVRSECFRRNFEKIGKIETFGFAGFFGVPLCYQGFSDEKPTDQFPVLLQAKHVVKEIPRANQDKAVKKFLEGHEITKAGHTLLHDMKENVVTPYVMVEAIGWFFGFKLFGKTLQPKWFKKAMSWITGGLDTSLGTKLTVDKISPDEAYDMVASKQRTTIYRLLTEKYNKSSSPDLDDQVERLRKIALNQIQSSSSEEDELLRLLKWKDADLKECIDSLRKEFNLHEEGVDNQMQALTELGLTTSEQLKYVETALRILGFTKTFARLVLFCGHFSTSDNNPYESALDCGACGGNHGVSNARALAAMANNPKVRETLAKKGLTIPEDTHFIPGQQDTVTDEVILFDLEDVPATHQQELIELQQALKEAREKTNLERLLRLPDVTGKESIEEAIPVAKVRSMDWSQVRPEWGLSNHTAFVMGRRALTQEINFEGRTFLHSYDPAQDPDGKYLEIIMTAPMIVTNWINMEHYFSTVDPMVYGAGSKVYHNVTGNIGVMYGSESDLCCGLPLQTIFNGERPYHEPMRLFCVIEAPLERIEMLVERHELLQQLTKNRWINLVAIEPQTKKFFFFQYQKEWKPIN